MAKIIVSTGRGGTGKTTFVALAARYLESPLLLIDLDPDQNLADMLGINLDDERTMTVSDALYNIIQKKKSSTEFNSIPLPNQMECFFHRISQQHGVNPHRICSFCLQ